MTKNLSAMILVFTCVSSSSVFSASFDCVKARSKTEILICNDQTLSKLDEDLAGLYRQAKQIVGDQEQFKADANKEWKWREANCADKQCLVIWYEKRKIQLQGILHPEGDAAPPRSAPASSSQLSVSNAVSTISNHFPRGEYAYNCSPESCVVSTYYPDGAFIRREFKKLRPQDEQVLFSIIVGICRSAGSQLDCRYTGIADLVYAIAKGRPNITQDDFKAINTEVTDLIQMDNEGKFTSKRIRVTVNGQLNPQAIENVWDTRKHIPTHNDKLDGLRQSIPARYFY